jgi:hypothetical protein
MAGQNAERARNKAVIRAKGPTQPAVDAAKPAAIRPSPVAGAGASAGGRKAARQARHAGDYAEAIGEIIPEPLLVLDGEDTGGGFDLAEVA